MDKGRAVCSTSNEGFRNPFLRGGILRFSDGKMEAKDARMKHHIDTEANWIMVNVAGLSKALRMDFDEVLVRAEVMYHPMQSALRNQRHQSTACFAVLTINL